MFWFPLKRVGRRTVIYFIAISVSRCRIRFEGKAQADEKTQHTLVCEYFKEDCNDAIGP